MRRLSVAWDLTGIAPAAKLAAIFLADNSNEFTTQMTVWLDELAEFACVTEQTALGLLQDLEFKGLIRSAHQLDDDGPIEVWIDPLEVYYSRPSRKPISKAVRAEIFERDGEFCAYCETTEGPFHIDHIHPVSRGGSDDPENLTVACAKCNISKRDKTLEEWGGRNECS